MDDASSATVKGKARADDSAAARSSALPPPRTPPRRQPPTFATPSSSTCPSTPSSKRKSQARITSYFPNKKIRVETIPFELSPAEKKARKDEEDDIKALIKDIEKEERETKKAIEKEQRQARKATERAERQAKRAEQDAKQQLKRETQLAAARERQTKAHYRANWNRWCEDNAMHNATFEFPKNLPKDDLWVLHRSITQCGKEFGLKRDEAFCLEHCCMPNYHNPDAPDITLFRLDDVYKLAWRKEAMLAGIECNTDDDWIAEGRFLFLEKQKAKTASKVEP